MGDLVSLADRRPDVFYTVDITQGWDGHLEVFVHDLSSDSEARKSAASAMRRAADLIENGTPEPPHLSSKGNKK